MMFVMGLLLGFGLGVAATIFAQLMRDGARRSYPSYQRKQGRE